MRIAINYASKELADRALNALGGNTRTFQAAETGSYHIEFESDFLNVNICGNTVYLFDHTLRRNFSFEREEFNTIELI